MRDERPRSHHLLLLTDLALTEAKAAVKTYSPPPSTTGRHSPNNSPSRARSGARPSATLQSIHSLSTGPAIWLSY
jgi:hypothetical protein